MRAIWASSSVVSVSQIYAWAIALMASLATLMRSRDPSQEFADMAGKALTIEWLIEHALTVFAEPA